MHIPTLAASLLAAAGFAAAAPASKRDICPVTQQGDYVWKLSNFYARKPDGITINSIGFNIKATNNGTLDFDCGAQADSIVDDKFYPCGEYSFISFAWQGDRSGVLLKQDVGDEIQYIGTATLPNYCRAGGNGPLDYVCQGVSDAYITLVQYPRAETPEE